jgi:hypothetical protein
MESRILTLLCLLAVSGVNVNAVMKGRSLFLFAAQVGSLELIERLLEFKETKVNEYNRRGTGLMIALEKGFKEISIKLIEDDRIDVNYVNMRSKSLVESATEGGHFEVLSCLISSPRFDAGFHNVHSALKLSIKGKSHELTKFLLDSPVFDIDIVSPDAQRSGKVQLLIRRELDLLDKDRVVEIHTWLTGRLTSGKWCCASTRRGRTCTPLWPIMAEAGN